MTSASTYSEQVEKRPSAGSLPPPSPQPELQGLPERPLPDLLRQCVLHGRQPAAEQIHVIANQAALQQIQAHSISNLRSELGGVLLGQAYRHDRQLFVEITAALPAVSQDYGPVHFTFSADSWSRIHRDKAAYYPQLDIIGWFHTHPGLGVFYSSDDVVVHSAAFTLPWHVGLVLDPIGNEACFFGWVKGELTPFNGFYEQLEQQEPVVSWRVVKTSVQHVAEDELAVSQYAIRKAYVPSGRAAVSLSPTSLKAMIGGAVGALILFFLLAGWAVSLNRQLNLLENVVLALADEGAAENNAFTCPNPGLRLLVPRTGARIPTGANVDVLGTADIAAAARYQVQVRPSGGETWRVANVHHQHTSLGRLARWDTTGLLPGLYEVRLTAVDRNNVRLANVDQCIVQVELIP